MAQVVLFHQLVQFSTCLGTDRVQDVVEVEPEGSETPPPPLLSKPPSVMQNPDPSLADIESRVQRSQRLEFDDGVALFQTTDYDTVRRLANMVRERLHGNETYHVVNRHINYSNICAGECSFCAFARRPGQEGGYTLSLSEIWDRTSRLEQEGVLEIHVVGSVNPEIPYPYYVDLVAGLRHRHPGVTIKAFSAVEVAHMAQGAGKPYADVLRDLKAAGIDALVGGGAEIFSQRVRKLLCPSKISAEIWLDVHRQAHRLGLKSNATMLYGHLETIEERVDHLLRLRSLQDETGGFLAFVPLPFHPENTSLSDISTPSPTDRLRTLAVSRLVLSNIPHIKCYWIASGIEAARSSLDWGADDLDGTVKDERIYHAAGAATPASIESDELVRLIRAAGRIPVTRDGLYRNTR